MDSSDGRSRPESISSFYQARDSESSPMRRESSRSSDYITRPVLVGSSNAEVAHLVHQPDALPSALHLQDFAGSPLSTNAHRPASPQAHQSDYQAFEKMLTHRRTDGPLSPTSFNSSNRHSSAADSSLTYATWSSTPEVETPVDPHKMEIERLKRVEAELRSQLEIERLRAVEADLRNQLETQRHRREEEDRRRLEAQIEGLRRGQGERERGLVGPKEQVFPAWRSRVIIGLTNPLNVLSSTGSDDSDVDPEGPASRTRRVHSGPSNLDLPSSTMPSHYNLNSARNSIATYSDSSSSGHDRYWDKERDRQGSATTVGSYYSDKESLRNSPFSAPTALSRRGSSKFSSGQTTPIDEEDGALFHHPVRSISRGSNGPRHSGLGVDYGSSSATLTSPSRHKMSTSPLGPPPPAPSTLPPPPPISYGGSTAAELGRKVSDPISLDSRSYTRRPSGTLRTLDERPAESTRTTARQGAVPAFPLPPSGGHN